MKPQRNFAHPHRRERSERAPVVTRHIDAKPEQVPAEVPAHVVCWGAFAPSRQSPETQNRDALARTPVRLVSRSLGGSVSLHAPNQTTDHGHEDG